MNKDKVCETLKTAELYSLDNLRSKAIRYISENCEKVSKTEGWKTHVKSNPSLELEILKNIAYKDYFFFKSL